MCNVHRIKCGNGNCYIVEENSVGILVDTGKREFADKVIAACRPYDIRLLVLTHAHFDHAENAARVSRELRIPIGMNEKDVGLIRSNESQPLAAETFLGKIVLSVSLKDFRKRTMEAFEPDMLLSDGDRLAEYGINASVVGLPGHTDGSIGVDVDGKHLLVGDALMNMFYPTFSMLFHDKSKMLESAEKIGGLGARTVHFGHGGPVSNRQWANSF